VADVGQADWWVALIAWLLGLGGWLIICVMDDRCCCLPLINVMLGDWVSSLVVLVEG
jgi:hypothetical protein